MKKRNTAFVTISLLGAAFFVGSCGAASDAIKSATEAEKLHAMPTGKQVQTGWDAIVKKSTVANPEIIDFSISYNKSAAGPEHDGAYVSAQIVSPDNKNKIVEYQYNFSSASVSGPTEVTISTGIGSDETFIEKYEELQPYLFKKDDIIAFDKLDALYQAAVEKSGYNGTECYVENLGVDKNTSKNDEMNTHISVQSTKSITASKSFSFDKAGNLNE